MESGNDEVGDGDGLAQDALTDGRREGRRTAEITWRRNPLFSHFNL